jgi:hypothetical protein
MHIDMVATQVVVMLVVLVVLVVLAAEEADLQAAEIDK